MKNSPDSSFTFAAFSLDVISSLPLRKKTKATYNSVLIKHVHPAIGAHRLDEVSREEIQKIILLLPPQISPLQQFQPDLHKQELVLTMVQQTLLLQFRQQH
jgi:hypothetical protein